MGAVPARNVGHHRDPHLTHTAAGHIANQLYALLTTCAPEGLRAETNVAPTSLPVLPLVRLSLPPLPATRAEMDGRGWEWVDVVIVSGDAYVDHPAFATGILARILEAAGFRRP